jgi:hypothetical protein
LLELWGAKPRKFVSEPNDVSNNCNRRRINREATLVRLIRGNQIFESSSEDILILIGSPANDCDWSCRRAAASDYFACDSDNRLSAHENDKRVGGMCCNRPINGGALSMRRIVSCYECHA